MGETINEYAIRMKVHRKTVEAWIKKDLLVLEYTPSGKKRIMGAKSEIKKEH